MSADLFDHIETNLLHARRVADERLEMLQEEQRANKVLQERVEKLEKENKILREGLGEYADANNWTDIAGDREFDDVWMLDDFGWETATRCIEEVELNNL